jgi:hypothetical protein
MFATEYTGGYLDIMNKIPGQLRKIRYEYLHNLTSLPTIFMVIK